MAVVTKSNGVLTVNAYIGDAKTLLAFNLNKKNAKGLAGFTIECKPDGHPPYYLFNTLQFKNPGDHAQAATEPSSSSINAPIHKLRWLHIPGSSHQGTRPFMGAYTYTVTPRYFDAQSSLLPIDAELGVTVLVRVLPFKKGSLELGFTRGFTQSQAFVNHFGLKAPLSPKAKDLLFDTSANSGTNSAGDKFSFADEYEWLGYTAREKIFGVLNEVLNSSSLRLDMFAYDFSEPDISKIALQLAVKGRIRVILDNASLHHDGTGSKPEDEFETLFHKQKKGPSDLIRGHFNRYSHDKVLIVSDASGAKKVLTGSTNFSLTGMYVNSNHVLVFDDVKVADTYAQVFQAAWDAAAKGGTFQQSALSSQQFNFSSNGVPRTAISFAPHQKPFAESLMTQLTDRVKSEGNGAKTEGSVLFAVMDLGSGDGPVRPALISLHNDQAIFSYGISDSVEGIRLYSPKRKNGVLVTGKPTNTVLPPPFKDVPGVRGHQIHHKFVVCGFNTDEAVVYCGSSNLATGGEEANGDNLIEIHDTDVATAFAIEALSLVDHFDFLDRYAKAPKGKKTAPAAKQHAAAEAGWFLSTTDDWTKPYYDPNDLRSVDRELFG